MNMATRFMTALLKWHIRMAGVTIQVYLKMGSNVIRSLVLICIEVQNLCDIQNYNAIFKRN